MEKGIRVKSNLNVPASLSLNVFVVENSNWSSMRSNSSKRLHGSGDGVAGRRKLGITFGVWISPTFPNRFFISSLWMIKHSTIRSHACQTKIITEMSFSTFRSVFFEFCLHLIYSPFKLFNNCCFDCWVNCVYNRNKKLLIFFRFYQNEVFQSDWQSLTCIQWRHKLTNNRIPTENI